MVNISQRLANTTGQRVRQRVAATILAVAVAVTSLAACSSSNDDADIKAMLAGYTSALSQLNSITAAGYTSSPQPAAALIGQTLADMRPKSLRVTVADVQRFGNGDAAFTLQSQWNFGPGRDWSYTTNGSATHLSIGWRIAWDPTVLAGNLTGGTTLRQIRTDAKAPLVRARDKSVLMAAAAVRRIYIDPSRTKNVPAAITSMAKAIEPIASLVTAASLTAAYRKDPQARITVATLRENDYQVVSDEVASSPGAVVVRATDLLVEDRQLNSPLFAGVTNAWQANRDATSGWAVQAVAANRTVTQLVGYQGPAGPTLNTVIDKDIQAATQEAVAQLAQPAAMVVMSTDTGAVLATSQNDAADAQSPTLALTEVKTPGPVLDPLTSVVNELAGKDAAKQKQLLAPLGLGVKFSMTGFDTATAALPGEDSLPAGPLTADSLNVSAFGMALFAAAIAKGRTVVPYVVNGQRAKPDRPVGDVDAKVRSAVIATMASTMSSSGDGSDLASTGVRALVGTNGPMGPGWFVGYRGNRAYAILVTGEKSGAGALQVATHYLK